MLSIYIAIIIGVAILLLIIFINPMNDSGDDFNANFFPFEIKDPDEWYKSKEDKEEIKKSDKSD